MARKNLTAGSTLNPSSSFATASIAPNGGDLVLAFAASVRGGGPATPTASGNGLTWNRIASVRDAGAGNSRITCFRAMGPAPSAGPLTFDFGGQQQSACAWSVFEYDKVDRTGTSGSGAVPQHRTSSGTGNTLAAMLGPLIDPASSLVVGGIVLSINEAVAAGAGLAQIDLRPFLKGGNRGTLQTEDRTGGGPTVDWRWPTNADAGAIALEIVTAPPIINPPTDDPETLARQFEPILFFHPDERFYPADAKHYVEQCALWRAQAPFDVKDSWGGKGAPFDRAPIIDYGKISALAGEPGTPLGPASLVDNEGEERFFDFKGWKDASGTPQPKVTATSKNSYSNRDAIDTQYNQPDAAGGNQKLRDSRFWYHAEFFEAGRLRRLLATVTAPDLVKVYDSLKNAALLNYYFFYPAHEELVAAACTNIEATEFGCFAGEWGCLSILLERPTPDSDFLPSFIGTSGRLLYAPNTPMAQAADDDDAANRTVMTVNPFPKANPVGGHPRIFVAKGTHALYLAPGPFVVDYPNESRPVDCGRFEGIPPPPAQPETHLADNPLAALGLLFAKVVAGASLLGALGAAAGLVWGIVEYAEADHGINNVATGDGPPNYAPDVTGSPGSGKMVRPRGLTVPDAGPDVQDWTSAQGLKIHGRRYDFIVDRSTQLWWPGDFNQGGYRGRWGLRVETDPFGRRAGMRFPEFWRIFFLALANGKASGAL